MEKTLRIINQLQKDGLIEKYAIGGGIAAIFYIEPITTFDLDIFIILPENDKKNLISLAPIYKWMRKRGYRAKKEQIIIKGIPVQFIPVFNNLVNDAVFDSKEILYKGVKTYIISAEYLIAIMIQTYRPKDKGRIIMFFQEAEISRKKLNAILKKYNLKSKFNNFEKLFYEK